LSETLPFGVISTPNEAPRCAVLLGDDALDLAALQDAGHLRFTPPFATTSLNAFLAMPRSVWVEVRDELESLVGSEAAVAALVSLADCTVHTPFAVGDYIDFFSSREHAENLGRMFRPDSEPLLPNWLHMPVGYHGRSSTVVASGTPVRRPVGQLPEFGPTQALDIELELGFVIGGSENGHGDPVPIEDAAERIFGVVLLNDWSARDIQRFEYQPLGPFLGKSFATSISPWVVPLGALEAQRVDGPAQDPPPLPYLAEPEPRNLDIDLEIELNGEVISRTNASRLYWSAAQQLAHAASGGAVIRAGDLHGTGTISGAAPDQCGSLIEIGLGRFLEDGDEVVMRGSAGAMSLGEVRGTIEPAKNAG
jgi:fumarylacetoacetase